MKTDILTPVDLFQKTVCYDVPPFQRPYVWSRDNQWKPLWEDVSSTAEKYLAALKDSGNNEVKATEKTNPHFLGAVVLKHVSTAAKDIERRDVIDGQQRVITLQLLLNSIKQIYEGMDHAYPRKAAKRLNKLVANDLDLIGDDETRAFKLWPTKSNRESFRRVMKNRLDANEKESLIIDAHKFFQEQVRRWLDDHVEPIEHRIDALEAAAKKLLQMVVIDLDSGEDPHLIFETLNARGTPLEQSDLIKNFTLFKNQDKQADIWGSLDDDWWRKKVKQGRMLRPRLDILFNYWLAMRTGSDVPPSQVFNAFRRYADDKHIHEVMSEAKQDLMNYYKFESAKERDPDEQSFHYHVDVMQAHVITPVLLLLLSAKIEKRVRSFDVLESYLARRMICRLTTKDYNRLFLELAKRLQRDGLAKADTTTTEFLKEQSADARVWPSDKDVAHALEDYPLYSKLSRPRMRLVLEAAETQLRSSGKVEHQTVRKNLSIEHLMPVGWKEAEWPLPDDIDKVEAIGQRETLIDSIGNLTLVTQKLNSSLSNASWKRKRNEFKKYSVLLINNELPNMSSWDEGSIRSRSQQLAALISERWPGPDSAKHSESSKRSRSVRKVPSAASRRGAPIEFVRNRLF